MDAVRIKAKYDWLVELCGAVAPGLAAGFAAFKLAPSFGMAPAGALAAAGAAGFGFGLMAMRAVPPGMRDHALAGFPVAAIDAAGEEPLLLDRLYEEPMLLDEVAEALADNNVLLLDDPLVAAQNPRVVRLFAGPPLPTPGQLKARIDRHLAAEDAGPAPDASEALYAALAELRRSLR